MHTNNVDSFNSTARSEVGKLTKYDSTHQALFQLYNASEHGSDAIKLALKCILELKNRVDVLEQEKLNREIDGINNAVRSRFGLSK